MKMRILMEIFMEMVVVARLPIHFFSLASWGQTMHPDSSIGDFYPSTFDVKLIKAMQKPKEGNVIK
jgi:hypothetical protein